jgi:hypothetical protein
MIRKTIQILAFLTATAASVLAYAENTVIGTVEATIDGQENSWYVLQPEGDMWPTAVWLAMGPERGVASINAYRSEDIPLVRDKMIGFSLPENAAPVLIIAFDFPVGASQGAYTLPSESTFSAADVIWQTDFMDSDTAYFMNQGSGTIQASRINANMDSDSSFSGTFSGTLKRINSEDSVTITNGRFEIDGVRFFADK